MVDVSLVICSRDRVALLRRSLQQVALLRTGGLRTEIVLVDNASTTNETRAVMDRFADRSHIPTVVVDAPVPGLGRARNVGIGASTGDVVVFTDDDCLPDPDYLIAAYWALHNTGYGFAGGRILLANVFDAAYGLDERTERFDYPAGCSIDVAELQGTSMAFTRTALDTIGGFDERLGPGTPWRADDLDAAQRSLYHGITGVHEPDMVVRHAHGRDWDTVDRLDTANFYARGGYHARFVFRHPIRHLRYLFDLNPMSRRGRAQWVGAMTFTWHRFVTWIGYQPDPDPDSVTRDNPEETTP